MASLCCYLVYIHAVRPLESLTNSTMHLCAGSSPAERLSSYCFFLSNLKTPISHGKENNISFAYLTAGISPFNYLLKLCSWHFLKK